MPAGVKVLDPFSAPSVWEIIERFYLKYYNDLVPRTFLIGINPGRLGAGITGIPFTDPVRLRDVLHISNNLGNKAELSSKFIYEIINEIGSADVFFGSFYITSVSPLGFVKDGKNLNYYDNKDLEIALESNIIESMWEQINGIASNREVAFCLGQGKNYHYFDKLNKACGFFERIVPLPHPRWVMQYRLKSKNEFIEKYISELSDCLVKK